VMLKKNSELLQDNDRYEGMLLHSVVHVYEVFISSLFPRTLIMKYSSVVCILGHLL